VFYLTVETKMTGKLSVISPFLIVCVLLFCGGCKTSSASAPDRSAKLSKQVDQKVPPEDKKKAAMLKKIENKFENPEAHFELGRIYQTEGLFSKAEHEYNTTLSFNPSHRKAQASLVKVLTDSGNKTKAATAADLFMNQVCASAQESLKLGLEFKQQGLGDYALACYMQALTLAPNSAKINKQIGYHYLSKGDKTKAREYLSRSFQLDPSQSEVAAELGKMGVAVRISQQKTGKNTSKVDKIVDQYEKAKK